MKLVTVAGDVTLIKQPSGIGHQINMYIKLSKTLAVVNYIQWPFERVVYVEDVCVFIHYKRQ